MWLVGMMGSGKTTSGRMAAEHLGVNFSDTDDIVSERMGCSIAQFWGERGEAAFREVEKVATASLSDQSGIRATGGGVVLDQDNRTILGKSSKVIWLRARPETLAARLEGQTDRPLVKESEGHQVDVLAETLASRTPHYATVATHHLDTDSLDTDSVAQALEEIWRS